MPDLSIIIVNYNVKEFLQNLLHSIEKASTKITSEIIIVDNASEDGSVELIKQKFPNVKLVENKTNYGFGKANNQALKISQGEFVLLINPDTIVSEDTFDELIKFFRSKPEAGLAGCKILNPDGTLQLACRRSFPGPWTSFCKVTGLSNLFPGNKIFARYNLTYLDENKTYEVDAISGSFMMIRREVYEKVGGFDEQFFMYGEDLDLCYRIKESGFKVFYVHSTQLIHYKGESTRRSNLDETKLFYYAINLFVKKHLSSSIIVGLILRIAIAFRKFFAFIGKRKLVVFPILIDTILFNLSVFAAEKIYMEFTDWVGFDPSAYYIIYSVPVLIHILIALSLRVYRKDSLSVLRNLAAILVSFIFLSSITFFFKQFAFSRAVVIISFSLFFIATVVFRVVVKLFFKVGIKAEGVISKRSLVVGTEVEAVKIAKKLKVQKNEVRSFIGLIGKLNSDIGRKIEGFEVVGSVQNFRKTLNEFKVNEVIFSSKELGYGEMMSLVSAGQTDSAEFKITGTDLNFLVGKTSVSMLDDIPLIEVHYNISNPGLIFIKTLFDYSITLPVLFLLYPFIYFSSKLSKKNSDFRIFILKIPSVLRGKYSLVGPKESGSNQNIFLGKTGLTGLWYIQDADESEEEKLNFYYAKNQNIWLDLEILGKTINKMWGRKI